MSDQKRHKNKCPNCGATEGIDMRSKMPNMLYWVCTNCLWGWHTKTKEINNERTT